MSDFITASCASNAWNSTANGQERLSGTLLIPGNQAGQVLQTLVAAAQEIEKKLRNATVDSVG